jgi:hypothetical protein
MIPLVGGDDSFGWWDDSFGAGHSLVEAIS